MDRQRISSMNKQMDCEIKQGIGPVRKCEGTATMRASVVLLHRNSQLNDARIGRKQYGNSSSSLVWLTNSRVESKWDLSYRSHPPFALSFGWSFWTLLLVNHTRELLLMNFGMLWRSISKWARLFSVYLMLQSMCDDFKSFQNGRQLTEFFLHRFN